MFTTPRRLRRAVAGVAGTALVAGVVALAPSASANSFSPSYFSSGVSLDSSAYALQFAGANREGTAAAIALDAALGGSPSGGYPFSTPSTAEPSTDSSVLYGPGKCPTTLVLAADDTPADALAAAALRSFTKLPVTDVNGVASMFDTTNTSLLLTESGRDGATSLDATTSGAIAKIKSKCPSIPYGIVLGGTSAIPASVLSAFQSQVGDVARIAGTDRFGTAAMVAEAAQSAAGSLPSVSYYASPSSASAVGTGGTSLTKAVFLAEGETGADALAVGALAARNGTPILLTDTSSLPTNTANALTTLAPKSIIVLGGTGAVDATVAAAATTAAGAGSVVTRIAGADRYATSVDIAEQLFNLYPQYALVPGVYSDELFGVARDEGSAADGNHVGWPDALASAYYLADLATQKVANPARTAPSVERSQVLGVPAPSQIAAASACGVGTATCFANYPLLLTSGATLAPEVESYLKGMYPSADPYKTGGAAPATASDGGFAFVFGGSGSVSASDLGSISSDLSGGTYNPSNGSDLVPAVSAAVAPFYTTVDLTPFVPPAVPAPGVTPTMVFKTPAGGSATDPKVCAVPDAVSGVSGAFAVDQTGVTDNAQSTLYYGATSAYPAGQSLGVCTDVKTEAAISGSTDTVSFYGSSLSGHPTAAATVVFPAAQTLDGSATGTIPAASPNSGNAFAVTAVPATESETIGNITMPFSMAGQNYGTGVATLQLTITRSAGQAGQDVLTWSGTLTGYASSSATTTPIFTATVKGGIVDATPVTLAPVLTPINLLGEYTLAGGGTGAIVMAVAPPTTPTGPSAVSGLEISGLS